MMKFLISIIILITTAVTFAQEQGSIQGIVLDHEVDNEPLAFAHVSLKGDTNAMRTEMDGSYSLQVKPGTYTLVFSFIGYKKQEVVDIMVKSGETTTVKDISLGALQIDKAQLSKMTANEGAKKVSTASLLFK